MGFEDELEAMNAYSEPPGTEAPGTTAPGTDSPGTTAPTTEAPGTSAPGTSAPATEAPTTEAPQDDELARIKAENDELKRQLEDAKKKPTTKAPGTTAPSTEAPLETRTFIRDDDHLDDVTRDPEKFNSLLNEVYQAGVKAARESGQKIDTVQLANQTAQVVTEMTTARQMFYEANADLAEMKDDVAAAFGDIAKANPTFNIPQVLEATAKEVRRRKNLPEPKPADNKGNKDKKPPNLPPGTKGKRSQGKPSTKQSKLESEIAAMNEMED